MKPIPEIQIMEADGTMMDLADDQRAPHNVKQFFELNDMDADERRRAYECWRANEPFVVGGGAAPLFRVLLVEPFIYIGGEGDERCSNPDGHEWAYTGTAYGGDDERWCGEGRSYCVHCGADGDA